jgi:hypothetical protein
VQVPCETRVIDPALVTVQTLVVDEVKVGVSPLVAEAIDATEKTAAPKTLLPPE